MHRLKTVRARARGKACPVTPDIPLYACMNHPSAPQGAVHGECVQQWPSTWCSAGAGGLNLYSLAVRKPVISSREKISNGFLFDNRQTTQLKTAAARPPKAHKQPKRPRHTPISPQGLHPQTRVGICQTQNTAMPMQCRGIPAAMRLQAFANHAMQPSAREVQSLPGNQPPMHIRECNR